MTEFELIRILTRDSPTNEAVVVGPGDDCAVLNLGGPAVFTLFKTDAVIEGVHFEPRTDPEKVGRKALGRCLSDIAAMAGTPVAAVVTVCAPVPMEADRLRRMYDGLHALARLHRVAVVGGETSATGGPLVLSVALIGEVAKDLCVYRSGAAVGDAIFVTGELGGSRAGKHLDFEPRLEEGRWLAARFRPHAMIDVSDGLAGDLRHILALGGVGAELVAEAIPVSAAAGASASAGETGKPPLLAALTDGEDFELLFTIAAGKAEALPGAWRAQFPGVRLSLVGRVTRELGMRLREGEALRELGVSGFEHFA